MTSPVSNSWCSYQTSEVAKHDDSKSCWIIIDDHVFDVTSYLNDHPGGRHILLGCAGKDATEEFNEVGHVDAIRLMDKYCIGRVPPRTTDANK